MPPIDDKAVEYMAARLETLRDAAHFTINAYTNALFKLGVRATFDKLHFVPGKGVTHFDTTTTNSYPLLNAGTETRLVSLHSLERLLEAAMTEARRLCKI